MVPGLIRAGRHHAAMGNITGIPAALGVRIWENLPRLQASLLFDSHRYRARADYVTGVADKAVSSGRQQGLNRPLVISQLQLTQ